MHRSAIVNLFSSKHLFMHSMLDNRCLVTTFLSMEIINQSVLSASSKKSNIILWLSLLTTFD